MEDPHNLGAVLPIAVPVTLYKEQWVKLLDMGDGIRSFITENEPALKAKGADVKE